MAHAVAAITIIGAACSEDPIVPRPDDLRVSEGLAPAQDQSATFDDEFARIARDEIPGFGGYYLDGDSTIVILLVDQTQATRAAEYVTRESAFLGVVPARGVAVRSATYDFAALKQWRDRLEPLIDGSAAFLLDIDEVRNRLLVGVLEDRAKDGFLEKAINMGVPPSALQVEVQPMPEFRATVQDYTRPIEGGLQITNNSIGGECTLGFVAAVGGAPRFLTAAHCSPQPFALDGSTANQPSAGYPIGTEVLDPAMFLCWPYGLCRYSDAALFSISGDVSYERGYIARTLGLGWGAPGSLIIDNTQPHFSVVSKWNLKTNAPVGTVLDKVGRTSGWTRGNVTQTCVLLVWGSGRRLICQWVTNIWSQPGDSGSPIFYKLAFNSNVVLHGSLWGGPASDFNTTWHSPLYGIEKDLGSLTVCRPSSGC
jgi:hypothetical protein